MAKGDKIIVALDVNNLGEMEDLVDKLRAVVKIFKIGSVFFTACGWDAVDMVHSSGAEVFLDLKFHDIPNTVKNVSQIATRHKIFMFNVHASGGYKMMKEAKDASTKEAKKLNIRAPYILGVTVLTSIDKEELSALGISKEPKDQVVDLANLTSKAGLDGVVASPKEAGDIRRSLGEDFIIVSPGIRHKETTIGDDDQKRFTTAKEAIDSGANYIVVGRPITEAENPRKATDKILSEINE